jgi:hypothetical protein
MLADMKLLTVRILLVLLAVFLGILWVPTALYYAITSVVEGQAWRGVLSDIWDVLKYDAALFWGVFKEPIDKDEDDAHGV